MSGSAPHRNIAEQVRSTPLHVKEEVRSKLVEQSQAMAILVEDFLSSVSPHQETSSVSPRPRPDLKTAVKMEAEREMLDIG